MVCLLCLYVVKSWQLRKIINDHSCSRDFNFVFSFCFKYVNVTFMDLLLKSGGQEINYLKSNMCQYLGNNLWLILTKWNAHAENRA